LSKSEKSIVCASKYIFASSTTIKNLYEKKYSCNIQLAQNGVDFDQISSTKKIKLADIKNKFRYIIGFSGSLLNRESKKIDFNLLNQIADHRQDCLMLLIGPYDSNPSKKIKLLRNKSNVIFLGLVDSSDIGGYIKNFDLALLPYLKNEFTSGIFPIKLYEYLACSIPISSINLPAAQHIFHSSDFLIQSANKSIFLDACDELLNREMMPQDSNKLMELASEADWSNTFNLIKSHISV
jgi:teichuronic acid biosynthesis glycosyltransferase TuaH